KLNGNGTGGSNIVRFRLMESNGSTEQAKLAMEGSNNLFLQNTVTFQSLQLLGGGGVNGFRFYDGTTLQKVWHQGNDGSGSGLDADTLDGLQSSVFVRNDGSSGTRFGSGYLQFGGDGASNNDYLSFNDTTNGYYFNADTARQNTAANAQVHAGEFFASGAYYYGDGKRMFQFSDGWLRLNPSNHFTSGIYCASSIVRTDNQLQVGPNGDKFLANSAGDVKISGAFLRSAHNTGYLEGSYNSVGDNAAQSNPIYVIGSAYVPGTTSLGSMYGIGYAHGGQASFLNSSDLGTNPANWGLYIAADGNARIFLNATSGIGYFKNVVYASNFILNSDRRLKEDIEDANVETLPVRWRKFKMKDDEEKQQRYGVIAQELRDVHPEFVNSDDEGNLTVKYIDLLVAKNAELEARIAKLEKIIK
ncbi:MAG: tail fiber domain-containing protein, partial [Saonia sp.]